MLPYVHIHSLFFCFKRTLVQLCGQEPTCGQLGGSRGGALIEYMSWQNSAIFKDCAPFSMIRELANGVSFRRGSDAYLYAVPPYAVSPSSSTSDLCLLADCASLTLESCRIRFAQT